MSGTDPQRPDGTRRPDDSRRPQPPQRPASPDGGPHPPVDRSGDLFRLVFEASPSAMVMVDQQGTIVLVNGQAESLFDYPREELLGGPLGRLIPERFRADHVGQRQAFFAAPATRAMGAGRDLFGRRRDGSEVPVEIGLNPIQTADGPRVLASIIDITERLQAADTLLASLREKELLLQEIHHRVKNNLAVIGSMLFLQQGTVDDESTRGVLRDCRARVQAMALVHERLYRAQDLTSIDFAEYTSDLARELFRTHAVDPGRVRLSLDIAPVALAIDRAIPCGLILNELVANALEHAFPGDRRGELRISLRPEGPTTLVLRVRDDGIGLPADHHASDQRTLGMRLVTSLARQLDATCGWHRVEPGTEFELSMEVEHADAGSP